MEFDGKIKVGIVGAAGYTAGELLRILAGHPLAGVLWAQSSSHAGEPVWSVHQDLLGETDLSFVGKPSPGRLLRRTSCSSARDMAGRRISSIRSRLHTKVRSSTSATTSGLPRKPRISSMAFRKRSGTGSPGPVVWPTPAVSRPASSLPFFLRQRPEGCRRCM